ncbi:FadR/GntR family transcriptional regulator [Rhizobium rhizogenes]|uniref:FadR/GntR family transcriptional regulator n=1 Tax=Rhizobium rhizogenes TaxID=359 RepID=UPI00129492A5|nr:GntR family transcriptional regulator [Rhizobium rhizogenes]MQB34198.1 FadR family transcriptional regulator [Rhizobium rhizogenes]
MNFDAVRETANYALEKLRELLASSAVEADGRLPTERVLSEMFGVGRRAIRRALEVLEAEGVVWRRQGSGTYVGRPPDGWSQHIDSIANGTNPWEVMEVRLRIEPQLAQLAAQRAGPVDIDRMYELVQKIGTDADVKTRTTCEDALRHLIAESAGNRFFLTIFEVTERVRQNDAWDTIREAKRELALRRPDFHRRSMEIVDAIAARDPVRATEAMRLHLLMLQECLAGITSFDSSDGSRARPLNAESD